MEFLIDFFKLFHTPEGLNTLIGQGGLLVLFAIIFAETGLLLGFFLPGDSLLVTAGIFASRKMSEGVVIFNIYSLIFVLVLAAVLGDQAGFHLGKKSGPRIFNRPNSRLFKKKYLDEAHQFYEKRGGWAIVISRFIPILRTFVPFIAGVARMPYRNFVTYNCCGGVAWVLSMTLLGYVLGKTPWAEKIHGIILIVIAVSILPLILGLIKRWWQQRRAAGILAAKKSSF